MIQNGRGEIAQVRAQEGYEHTEEEVDLLYEDDVNDENLLFLSNPQWDKHICRGDMDPFLPSCRVVRRRTRPYPRRCFGRRWQRRDSS